MGAARARGNGQGAHDFLHIGGTMVSTQKQQIEAYQAGAHHDEN